MRPTSQFVKIARLAGLVIVGAALCGASASAQQGNKPNQDSNSNQGNGSAPVTIVSPLPLPVTGTVNIGSGGSVTVTSSASAPVFVREANEPFQAENHNSSDAESVLTFATVPSGKRLVIEHVSVNVNISAAGGAVSGCVINAPDASSTSPDFFALQPTASNALNHIFVGSVQTKYYVDAGKTLLFQCDVFNAPSAGSVFAFISGHYEPVP